MYKSGNDFNLSTGSTLMQSAMSFSSPTSSATTMIGGGMPFQSTLVSSPEGIDLAGRTLEWHLKSDSMFPQLSEQLRVGNEGKTNWSKLFIWCSPFQIFHFFRFCFAALAISGLSDVDYPTLELGPNGLPLLRQMGLVNRVPLPPELVEHFARKSLPSAIFAPSFSIKQFLNTNCFKFKQTCRVTAWWAFSQLFNVLGSALIVTSMSGPMKMGKFNLI